MCLLSDVPALVGHAQIGRRAHETRAADCAQLNTPRRRASPISLPNQLTNFSALKGQDHMSTTNGTIKRITDKGFGFITTEEGTEYFFHQSACAGTRFDDLREGQTVSFTVGQGPKGPRAENVSLR